MTLDCVYDRSCAGARFAWGVGSWKLSLLIWLPISWLFVSYQLSQTYFYFLLVPSSFLKKRDAKFYIPVKYDAVSRIGRGSGSLFHDALLQIYSKPIVRQDVNQS